MVEPPLAVPELTRAITRSARLRKNQRTEGKRKCDAKVTPANKMIRTKAHTGMEMVCVIRRK